MVRLPAVAARQCGVFSTTQAFEDGLTISALRHAVRCDAIRRLRVGAYAATDLEQVSPGLSPFEQARWRHAAPGIAAALTSRAFASHSTAAVLEGVPLLFLPERACVCVAPTWTGRIDRVHLHRCPLPPRAGEAVARTSVERTVIDLAREHGMLSGLVAADFALHTRLTTLARLLAELDRCERWPGVRAAREAIAFADGRSESVLETRSRLLLQQWGLPAPVPQVRIGNEWGGLVARVDFYWDEFGVVGEVDGAMKYDGTDARPLHEEKKRQEKLEQELELPVVRWGNADLHNFGAIATRLRRRFAKRAGLRRDDRLWRVLPPL